MSGMAESLPERTPAALPRPSLAVFLALVLLVRLGHLALLGTWLTGMNPKMAVLAKEWLRDGWGATGIDVAPGPVCLLAGVSGVLGIRPTQGIPLVLLLAHLCLAAGFWYWLRSLRPHRDLALVSLFLFLFLPGHNSYIGLDNFPTVLAAAAFLGATSLWHPALRQPITVWSCVGMSLLAAAIALFRGEYVYFLPLYVAVVMGLSWCWQGQRPPRRVWLSAAALCLGLGAGLWAVMLFRYIDSGHFALVARDYTCWAFLDGTPPAWQSPEDDSETDRVQSGIRRFGHPAEYGYSATRMMWQHPGPTVAKCLLNLPSWLFELGRRHVVIPLPLAVLAVLGAILIVRRRGPATLVCCWPPLFASILMTLPIVALIVSARYLLPAFGAVCVLAAGGWLAVVAGADQILRGRVTSRTLWWAAVVVTGVTLELLLLRGGGLLRDASHPGLVARSLDEQFGQFPQMPLILDPHSDAIDADCRAQLCNRWIYRQQGLSQYGFDPRDPLAAATSVHAAARDVRCAVIWAVGAGDAVQDRQRLSRWQESGYELEHVSTLPAPDRPQYTVFVLRRSAWESRAAEAGKPAELESEH